MRRLAIATVFVLFAPAVAHAGAIAGVAVDRIDRTPLAGATMEVTAADAKTRRLVLTDQAGRARVDGLAPGRYDVAFYYGAGVARFTGIHVTDAGHVAQVMAAIDQGPSGCVLFSPPSIVEEITELGDSLVEFVLGRGARAAGGASAPGVRNHAAGKRLGRRPSGASQQRQGRALRPGKRIGPRSSR